VGKKKPDLAILLMGWVVSIPVFCDSGFVILDPIRKSLADRTKTSRVTMTVALSAGLYVSHVFIPPTPGPIAAANTLGIGNNLLLVIGLGVLVSIPALITGYLYAKRIGKTVQSTDEVEGYVETLETYEEIVAKFGKLPSGFAALAPILVPIILMAMSSIVSMASLTGIGADLLLFFGNPVIALAVGMLFAIYLLKETNQFKSFHTIIDDTLKTVGPILFITASGGVLGKVIAESGMVDYITSRSTVLEVVGIFFPFLLAAILKTAQGSSTVAITTTAGIVAPLMVAMGLNTPVLAALTVMAIGAGAMTVSHANDSYFWVVTNFGNMEVEDGYKTQTMVTLLMGVVSIIFIFLLSLIF
ncbi:MAG: GntP family permease, partial [Clostridium sp.]|nr:GntP family permease [Clostridium sp.]